MALSTMIKRITDAHKAYKDAKESLGGEAKIAIAEHFGKLLPPGFALAWNQYTPYFNDGEPCKFSVHSPTVFAAPSPDASGERPWRRHPEGLSLGEYALRHYGQDYHGAYTRPATPLLVAGDVTLTRECALALETAWNSLPEDTLETAFGDHASVRIFEGAVTIDECDHD